MKETFNTFGIAEELTSDGGPEFSAAITKKTLKDWGVQHRISSVEHACSNGRVELCVKSMKRLLMDNTGPYGNHNNDAFLRAILQYWNTPDGETGISPAMYLYRHPIRDFLPNLNISKWQQADWRGAIATRNDILMDHNEKSQARLKEHTRHLPHSK